MPVHAKQLRLVLETDDLEAAVAFYRDALGLTELESYDGPDGAKVHILGVPSMTLELANSAQVRYIDDVEVGAPTSRPYARSVRVAFEVVDAAEATTELEGAGASVLAAPMKTPWNSLNARLEAPDGMQVTVFEELS